MPATEHFVTLFDANFLPQGLALFESLRAHCPHAKLWVLCMDEEVERTLAALNNPGLQTIPLREIEDSRLRKARADRNAREYCWTVTAFTFDAVFSRCPEAMRTTYLDADLFFFGSPRPLFEELESSGASILVTEHGFDPAYDKSELVGRFCVQFLTMDRSRRAAETLHWWQEKVLEWCYDRREPGRFGDQKYLDEWPRLFGDRLRILAHRELALAPWNVRMESRRLGFSVKPAFYHFHSFRIVSARRARMVEAGYAIPRAARPLYREYAEAVGRSLSRIEDAGVRVPILPIARKSFNVVRQFAKLVLGRADSYIPIRREA
jgi:hypothetical protein